MRNAVKSLAGQSMALINPQCRYDRSIFILAHMRCGSTALSNILCSRPDVSGYGEAHIRYDGQAALGRLVVNQALRGGWSPKATHLFDKLLHSRHDAAAPEAFFSARAIFVTRPPAAAIRSIRKLYASLDRSEYGTDVEAAQYYIERHHRLAALWDRFPADRRIGLTHADLMSDPEGTLARISGHLDLTPPLENRYDSPKASRKGGGGDPTTSGKYTSIKASPQDPSKDAGIALDIPPDMRRDAEEAHAALVAKITG